MKRIIHFCLVFLIMYSPLFGQDDIKTEDLLLIKLPPLEDLFESAKSTPNVEHYAFRKEAEISNLKSERRKWLKYFSLGGSYQYGVMGANSYMNLGANLPIIYETSGSAQIFYNIGVSMSVNLGELYDRKNTLNRQKITIIQTEKEQDMWFAQQKLLIIDAYTTAMAAITMLPNKFEAFAIANAQFGLAEQQFIQGKIDGVALFNQKNAQVQAKEALEETRKVIISSIMKLEIHANTKILKK